MGPESELELLAEKYPIALPFPLLVVGAELAKGGPPVMSSSLKAIAVDPVEFDRTR
jgi:hypothetical protein